MENQTEDERPKLPDGKGGLQARKLSDESVARAISFIKSRNVDIDLVIRPEAGDPQLRSTIIVGRSTTS